MGDAGNIISGDSGAAFEHIRMFFVNNNCFNGLVGMIQIQAVPLCQRVIERGVGKTVLFNTRAQIVRNIGVLQQDRIAVGTAQPEQMKCPGLSHGHLQCGEYGIIRRFGYFRDQHFRGGRCPQPEHVFGKIIQIADGTLQLLVCDKGPLSTVTDNMPFLGKLVHALPDCCAAHVQDLAQIVFCDHFVSRLQDSCLDLDPDVGCKL